MLSHMTSDFLQKPRRWFRIAVFANTTQRDVDVALKRIRDWNYDGLCIDLTRERAANRTLAVRAAKAGVAVHGLQDPILLRTALNEVHEFIKYQSENMYLNIVIHMPMEASTLSILNQIPIKNGQIAVTVRCMRETRFADLREAVRVIQERKVDIHLEFPFTTNGLNKYFLFSDTKIFFWLTQLRSEFPTQKFLPPLGWGLDDPYQLSEENLAPQPELVFERGAEYASVPDLSIIVPTFNQSAELMNTLRHLSRQSVSRDAFETIIVDCGSSDTTLRDIQHYYDTEGKDLRVTAIKIPRLQRKIIASPRFRSALAFNVGATKSMGGHLMFFDARFLAPRHLLESIFVNFAANQETREALRVAFVPSIDLLPEEFAVRLSYDQLPANRRIRKLKEAATQSADNSANAVDWKNLSGQVFAVSSEAYRELAGFRENFASAEFAEFDFAWRLKQLGCSFQKIDHLLFRQCRKPHDKPLVRFLPDLDTSASCSMFYRHNLSDEIFTFGDRKMRMNAVWGAAMGFAGAALARSDLGPLGTGGQPQLQLSDDVAHADSDSGKSREEH